MTRSTLAAGMFVALGGLLFAAEKVEPNSKPSAERGKTALTGRAYTPAVATIDAYQNLWQVWGLKEKPADFDKQVRERYGLHDAPYPNNGLPMGLREGSNFFGKGVTIDCMLCHSSSIAGQPVMGLGNPSLDLQMLMEDLARAQGFKPTSPVTFSHVRGTFEATATTEYLFHFRDADLNVVDSGPAPAYATTCEDVPAWWNMKRKKTIYHAGTTPSTSVRTLMAFMLSPLNSGKYIKDQETTFRDIQAYLFSLEAPKYPFAIDEKKAEAGKELFVLNCAKCHGTYGSERKYPNRVVDLETIGTDRGLSDAYREPGIKRFNDSWFGKETGPDGKPIQAKITDGYQAPPLDGVWATAPYFHNGSAPTIYHVLNSKERPKIFTRSFRTGKDDYDSARLGWKFTVLDRTPAKDAAASERRKVYDTTQPGRGNGGHTFGDKLTEEERAAVMEYLKTL